MNIENIDERLLRTERERDEARAEVEKIKAREAEGVALFDSLLARERAELARLRAAANERAIAELVEARRELGMQERTTGIRSDWNAAIVAVDLLLNRRIAALRAETPAAPQPAPSGGVERAITELSAFRGWAESDGDWSLEHGGVAYRKVVGRVIERIAALRAEQQAAPVPPAVEVFREAAKNCTGEMFGEAAAVKPKGQEFVFEGVMWVPAPGQKQDDIERSFKHLTDFFGSRLTMRRVTPPADAPQRPSVLKLDGVNYNVDDLRWLADRLASDAESSDFTPSQFGTVRTAVRLLLDDALAARGEGAK